MDIMLTDSSFLSILQLTSPALPVGAYSYSEGLETLVEQGIIVNQQNLQGWLTSQLRYGAIKIEAAVMVRAYKSVKMGDLEALAYWNRWLSAARETEELRTSSWQMGRSLIQLLGKLQPEILSITNNIGNQCNYAIAFGIAAAHWQIDIKAALLGYLHSWASNLITAGVKIIPLGQTAGQMLLLDLQELLSVVGVEILALEDDDLACCTWGLSLASMQHETQYTRLFRS
ncbi:urease accessory protein UreF [Calothrix sp. FACHB-1219]|uniref:urease accessory protein UreF n=1 Tax=unclassified Calothrix TaxID=2619626 RepID=UPI00168921B7|nr:MULTISPECIES: urease accessory protein UreF [unclassified Calothrix]MBD2204817.1 urease accessory protein UreF [Calothrix sp. FACHB-168]MBD2218035.1 urease accessory protein UreF [Calothrix sp. FACHB-1219]